MIEKNDGSDAGVELKTPTIEELIDAYIALGDEERDDVHERAAHLRFGPTGMNNAEAILAVMAERLGATEDQL
ncbi:MAG: hypothetical protein KA604_00640 [Candidatus Saccharimonas sp.]|nr:hypothetical protein [Candidatus Saccharimonas sp.]